MRPLVGTPLPRREDASILRGEARYLDDLEPEGTLHVAFVRSPFAHARLGEIRPPRGAEGVAAVITAAELAGRARSFPIEAPQGMTTAAEPHPVLAEDVVRYAGQPVAAVAADSRALAEDAAELVEVDYEPLDPVVAASADGEQLARFTRSGGDVEAAFEAADHVTRRRHALPRLVAAPIEPRGAIAAENEETGRLTVWCSAQDPHRPLAHLAHILERPTDEIRIVVPAVGGAFGSKGVIGAEVATIAAAAGIVGRPLKWAEDRLENFLGAYQGRGVAGDVELALSGDGRMLAVRATIVADLGAYLMTTTAIPPHTAAMLVCGCYAIPAAEVDVIGVSTNKVPTGPYRGAGRPEGIYLIERTVDAAARELGIDPVELRRRNLVTDFPHRTPLGWTYDSGDYGRCLDLALELAAAKPEPPPGRLVGSGVAMLVERAGGQFETAEAEVAADGRVVIASGSSPHGQGHETTFAQIAADRLGIDMARVELRFGDTDVVPRGIGTFASRSVAMGGSALLVALDELIERATALAAILLETEPERVDYAEGRFAAGRAALSWAELAVAAADPDRRPPGFEARLRAAGRFESEIAFSSGAYVATVEVDAATGAMRLLRIAAVDDAGRIVNPLLAEGQVVGATVQGIGECLVEEAVHDDTGQLRTASFADYSLPTAAEVPAIVTGAVESPSPLNPLGAKGIGEGGAIGTPAAVANALADAIGGDGIDPPFTEDRLWRALHDDRDEAA